MRIAKVLARVLGVLVVETVLAVTWFAAGASTEACNNGKDIWLCEDGVAQGLVVAVVAWPIAACLAAVCVLAARSTRRHRDSD